MTRDEFINQCKMLVEERGYGKNFTFDEKINNNGTHYLYKPIEYADDKYGDKRAINQLILKVWNFEDYADRVPKESLFSLEPVVSVSRDTEELVELHIHYPKHDIEYLEEKAREFGQWCKQHMDY